MMPDDIDENETQNGEMAWYMFARHPEEKKGCAFVGA